MQTSVCWDAWVSGRKWSMAGNSSFSDMCRYADMMEIMVQYRVGSGQVSALAMGQAGTGAGHGASSGGRQH